MCLFFYKHTYYIPIEKKIFFYLSKIIINIKTLKKTFFAIQKFNQALFQKLNSHSMQIILKVKQKNVYFKMVYVKL